MARGECTVHVDGGTLVVAGEVDRYSYSDFVARLWDMVRARADVIVDMTDVTFIDSTGISALVLARQWADAHTTTLEVLPSKPVERVVKMLGLDDLLLA